MAHVFGSVRGRVGQLLARRQLGPADDTAPVDSLAEGCPLKAIDPSLRVCSTLTSA